MEASEAQKLRARSSSMTAGTAGDAALPGHIVRRPSCLYLLQRGDELRFTPQIRNRARVCTDLGEHVTGTACTFHALAIHPLVIVVWNAAQANSRRWTLSKLDASTEMSGSNASGKAVFLCFAKPP
jgi:hypothetical protein